MTCPPAAHSRAGGLFHMKVNYRQEVVDQERFGDEADEPFGRDGASLEVGNECRAEYCPNSRVYLLEFAERFNAGHLGHEHIEYDQIDHIVKSEVDLYGFGPAGARGYAISARGKNALSQAQNGHIIVNHEDMPGTAVLTFCIVLGAIGHGVVCSDVFPDVYTRDHNGSSDNIPMPTRL